MRVIEGDVLPAGGSEDTVRIQTLETELRNMRRELADAKIEAKRAREDADRAFGMLRRQLSPLYRALQAVFGELDAAGVTESEAGGAPPSSSPAAGQMSAALQSWKTKMPGRPAEFIDILFVHDAMTVDQLKVAARCGSNTVYDTVSRLKNAGVVTKVGNKYTLVQR